jgi:group I intron endonuclease
MIGIYKFTNKVTGESYIGQSTNIRRRYLQHKNRHQTLKESGKAIEDTYFHSMLEHYGFSNFDFEVIEECSIDELNDKEIYYILLYQTHYPKGYNLSEGGHLSGHFKLDKETIDKIYEDLENSELTELQIADKYSVHLNTICQINTGNARIEEGRDYPVRKIEKAKYYCKKCGDKLYSKTKTGLCLNCYCEEKTSYIPNKETLYKLLLHNSFVAVGKKYGVSDAAVRKWCVKYNIPKHSSYYRALRIDNTKVA